MTGLVLASASRARAALLRAAGVAFAVAPADVDEEALRARLARAGEADADAVALALATAKAEAVSARHGEALVVGADQILTLDGEIFAKPAGRKAARAQLERLRGRTHTLHSAFACVRAGRPLARHCARAELTMRPFSDAFLDAYLDRVGASALASVGAYQLEGPGVQLFERVAGDYFAILGLPLLELLAVLRREGALAS